MPSPLTIGALGTALGSSLKGSTSSGGSTNSAKSISYSNTAGHEATSSSNLQAQTANNTAMNAWREAAEFNAREAAIQREWQEKMSNTVYQRSVADMKKAGINPILAAGMGLGTASVGSGATASVSNPEVFMGQSFAEQNSAMTSQSHGSSWNNSESGLATGLQAMGDAIKAGLQSLSSAKLFDIQVGSNTTGDVVKDVKKGVETTYNTISKWWNNFKSKPEGMKNSKYSPNVYNYKPPTYHNNGL